MRKRKAFIYLAILIIIVWACHKSNFDKGPIGLLYESDLANKDGVEGLLIGAYSLLDGNAGDGNAASVGCYGCSASNWLFGSITGTEAHIGSQQTDQPEMRDIEKFKATPNDYYFDAKWAAIYSGVAKTNTVLRVMRQAHDMTAEDTVEVRAETLFLRAFYHFEAVKFWNKVPFVDEAVTYDAGNYFLSNDTLIWPAIERDLQYAMEHLPEVQGTAVGRTNKYAAEALLAKAYLFDNNYSAAKPLLNELIEKGVTAGGIKYGLSDNFGDNFNIEFKNRSESVFAIQASVNDGASGGNGNYPDQLNFPQPDASAGIVAGTCCGFFQPSQYLVNHYKTDPVTGLPDLDLTGDDLKNDDGISSTEQFKPYSGSIDPRLDWTVGRRGVPYLDWGPQEGSVWIRDQNYSGPYVPKKNIYYHSQQDRYTDQGYWAPMTTANNVNLIRFSDILLWAAEVEVEVGDPNKARDYVNMIRQRAANAASWVKNDDNISYAKAVTNNQAEFDAINDPSFTSINGFDWVVRKDLNQTWVAIIVNNDGTKVWNAYDIPNYNIGLYTDPWDQAFARKAVRYERQLELGMEGHRFFDLVRWNIADIEINDYLQKEKKLRTYLNDAVFIKGKNEYYPIPQNQINLSTDAKGIQHLHQNPGY